MFLSFSPDFQESPPDFSAFPANPRRIRQNPRRRQNAETPAKLPTHITQTAPRFPTIPNNFLRKTAARGAHRRSLGDLAARVNRTAFRRRTYLARRQHRLRNFCNRRRVRFRKRRRQYRFRLSPQQTRILQKSTPAKMAAAQSRRVIFQTQHQRTAARPPPPFPPATRRINVPAVRRQRRFGARLGLAVIRLGKRRHRIHRRARTTRRVSKRLRNPARQTQTRHPTRTRTKRKNSATTQ